MSDFQARQINKKKKFVADGIFHAELHEYLALALKDFGYGGVVIKSSINKTKICPRLATGGKDSKTVEPRTTAEITRHIMKRFGFKDEQLKVEYDKVQARALCAAAQVEVLRDEVIAGSSVRKCAMKVIRSVMRFGKADGCEVVISGKMRQQRAKAMKYREGYLVSTGHPTTHYIDTAIRHIGMKQGMMGLKVKIMLPYKFDPTKQQDRAGPAGGRGGQGRGIPGGVSAPLPDKVLFHDIKAIIEDDILPTGNNVPQQQAETPADE